MPQKPARKRSAKQIALSEAMESLAKAKRVTLMPNDYAAYNEVAQALIVGTVEAWEFERYVMRLRKRAPSEDWNVDTASVYALIAKERITEYVTARNTWLKTQSSSGNPQEGQWTGDAESTVVYHQPYQPIPTTAPLTEDQRAEVLRETQAQLELLRSKKAVTA